MRVAMRHFYGPKTTFLAYIRPATRTSTLCTPSSSPRASLAHFSPRAGHARVVYHSSSRSEVRLLHTSRSRARRAPRSPPRPRARRCPSVPSEKPCRMRGSHAASSRGRARFRGSIVPTARDRRLGARSSLRSEWGRGRLVRGPEVLEEEHDARVRVPWRGERHHLQLQPAGGAEAARAHPPDPQPGVVRQLPRGKPGEVEEGTDSHENANVSKRMVKI